LEIIRYKNLSDIFQWNKIPKMTHEIRQDLFKKDHRKNFVRQYPLQNPYLYKISDEISWIW